MTAPIALNFIPRPIADTRRTLELRNNNGGKAQDSEEQVARKQALFDRSQLMGSVAMLDGGGAAPLGVLIETENGWLVRVDLDARAARQLAAAILTHAGDE